MRDLRALQHAFWSSVRTSTVPEGVFRSRGGASSDQRMAVYRSSYWVRQVSALRSLAPTVVAALGDERFAQLASRFIAECPSEHWAIEVGGEAFAAWLATNEPALAQAALIDWVRFRVFIAPHLKVLTAQALNERSLLLTPLTLGPHVGVAAVEGSAALAIWRSGFEVREAPVSQAEANTMRAAEHTLDFDSWCGLMAGPGSEETQAEVLVQRLFVWLHRGWLIEGTR